MIESLAPYVWEFVLSDLFIAQVDCNYKSSMDLPGPLPHQLPHFLVPYSTLLIYHTFGANDVLHTPD